MKRHAAVTGSVIAAITAIGAAASADPPVNPLQSPACLAAQQRLDVQEELTRRQRSQRPALDAARQHAGVVCLRAPDAPPTLVRSASSIPSPIPVPSAADTPAPLPGRRPASPAAVVPAAQPLLSVTGCDALGCWASDGTRLQRVGPALLGPRGYCSTAGAVLSCP